MDRLAGSGLAALQLERFEKRIDYALLCFVAEGRPAGQTKPAAE